MAESGRDDIRQKTAWPHHVDSCCRVLTNCCNVGMLAHDVRLSHFRGKPDILNLEEVCCGNLKCCKLWIEILKIVYRLKYDSGHNLKHSDNGSYFSLECIG